MLTRRDLLRRAGAGLFAPAILAGAPAAATARKKTYEIPEEYLPTEVRLHTRLDPGEIHVDPNSYRLYWTLPNRKAIRYTVGIGRKGLYEAGEFRVGRKAKWPSWTPTANMVRREPHKYARFADGVPGGPDNPLGARALYLYDARGRDTMLRIHGTNAPWTVPSSVSNGCARLVNAHIVDLYDRVPVGTRVVLYEKGSYRDAS